MIIAPFHEGVTGAICKNISTGLVIQSHVRRKQASIYHYQLFHCQRDLPKIVWAKPHQSGSCTQRDILL